MASISDNYEINVIKKRKSTDQIGVHFCKIQLPTTIYTDEQAEEKLQFFRDLFGYMYRVNMTHWTCRGEIKDEWK